jgi:galactokinase
MTSIVAALWGEREWVGVRCGIMDPYAVALSRPGHVLWLECKQERFEHLPFDRENLRIAVVDSGIRP